MNCLLLQHEKSCPPPLFFLLLNQGTCRPKIRALIMEHSSNTQLQVYTRVRKHRFEKVNTNCQQGAAQRSSAFSRQRIPGTGLQIILRTSSPALDTLKRHQCHSQIMSVYKPLFPSQRCQSLPKQFIPV